MTKLAKLSLAEVIDKLTDKLDEAADFLEEMEHTKQDEKRFTHRVSALLSAAASVTLLMERNTIRVCPRAKQKQ